MNVDLIQKAISCHQAGEMHHAALIYQQILETEPDHADANHLLGLIAHQSGNNEAAAQLILKAAEENPAQPLYLCNLGIVRMALKQWDEAITAFNAALQSNHGDAKLHFNLGIAMEEKGRFEEAIHSYQNALSLTPGDTEMLNRLGNVYARLKRLEDAKAVYQQALEINPSSIATLNNLGITLRDHGQLDESIDAYRRALEIDPKRVEILGNLAMALLDAGQLQEAESTCQQALSYDPAYAATYKQLSDSLHFQQRISDWSNMLETALKEGHLLTDMRNYMLTSRAAIAWIDGDVSTCKDYLVRAEAVLDAPPVDKLTYATLGYYKFLQALLSFRSEHPSLYVTEAADKNIHMVGDSHSLSYTGTVISLAGKKHKVIPHLIMGCKAWHLAQPEMNRFKASFDCVIGQLPHGATVIIAIGEIDCRLNEGIFPAHKKYQTDLESSIESLVNDFVQYVRNKAREKELKLIFYGVPAPNCTLSHLSSDDRPIFLKTIELFNDALARAASADNRFIDVYRQTVTEGGTADGRYHVDAFHLSPDFLTRACLHLEAAT